MWCGLDGLPPAPWRGSSLEAQTSAFSIAVDLSTLPSRALFARRAPAAAQQPLVKGWRRSETSEAPRGPNAAAALEWDGDASLVERSSPARQTFTTGCQPSWRRRNAGTSNVELRSKSRSTADFSVSESPRSVSLPPAPPGTVGPAAGLA